MKNLAERILTSERVAFHFFFGEDVEIFTVYEKSPDDVDYNSDNNEITAYFDNDEIRFNGRIVGNDAYLYHIKNDVGSVIVDFLEE